MSNLREDISLFPRLARSPSPGLALAAPLQMAFPALPAGLSSVAGALPGPVLTEGRW